MAGRTVKPLLILALTAGLAAALAMPADAADAKKGERIYSQRCELCHGADGDGLGPAAERLNPPPRDFSLGLYKIKTSAFDEDFPNDADLVRMVRDGMPGTAMPGWSDVLSDQDIGDVIAFIKTFAEIEEQPENQVDYGTRVASSPDSIAKGRTLFFDGERCSECHGKEGKGDAVKKLKDDNGARTWPRNLTKPWTFRGSNDPKDIFTRVSVGIPGTQMPSFADPKSKKRLSVEDRWHVANYVSSLVKTEAVVRPENTVIKAGRLDGKVPVAPDDPRWAEAEPTTFFMLPQIIAKERFFTPANDTITVRAFYDADTVALFLEWDDRTKSIPGDPKAEKIADPGMGEDRISVQLPAAIPAGMKKPYFAMGDAANPVNLWQWSSGTTEEPARVGLFDASGADKIEKRDTAKAGLAAKGSYKDGTWRVVMRRPLTTAAPENDLQIAEGRFIPIAFAAWDGSNGETGSKHTLTTWYWLLLKPPTGARPIIVALVVVMLLAAGEVWWARSAARPRPPAEA